MIEARGLSWLILLAGLAVADPAGGAPEAPAAWTHRKAIALPPLGGPAFVEVLLDDEVYRDAAPALADLRIRDREGRDVGYVLRRHERPPVWEERERPLLDLQETPGRQVRFVVDVGPATRRHNRVRIGVATEARNFRVPVKVETSAGGREWDVVRAAGFVYVVEGESRAADTTVSYPTSTARFVRVTVTQPPGRRLPVTAAAVILETPAERDEDVRPVGVVEQRETAGPRASRLVVDLGGRRPVDRVEVEVADRTFFRPILVEAGETRESWRAVGSGALSAVETPRLRERRTSVPFAEQTTRYLRLTIHNSDDRPLDVRAVRVATVRRGLVFEARPDGGYAVDYGNHRAAAPRYDLARAFPYVGSEALPAAALGPARPLESPPPGRWGDGRLVVWAAMGAAALGLAGLLVRLARQLKPRAG